MSDAARLVSTLVRTLPAGSLDALQDALADDSAGLQRLRARAATSELRDGCQRLLAALVDGVTPAYLQGALAAARVVADGARDPIVDVVWTGPDSGGASSRLTLGVITDLVATATREVLLVSYAAHSDERLSAALAGAVERGVSVTLLLERSEDNPTYRATGTAFPSLPATRLIWPGDQRPAGAALHAKILLVDRRVALIGSANLTSRALDTNLECGVLLHDADICQRVHEHVEALRSRGLVRRQTS